MRTFSLLAVFSLAALGGAQGAKRPGVSLRNESNRPIEVSVTVLRGKREVPVGSVIRLAVGSGWRAVPGFFGPPREKVRYTVVVSDAKHRRLGLFRLDSRFVRIAEKNGMRCSINNQAVNVTVGSRRQRFLLLP